MGSAGGTTRADDSCRPLSLIVTGGQRADCTQFKAVLEKIRVPRVGPGRPREKPAGVAADQAYSNGPCREHLRRRVVRHTIREKIRFPRRPPAQRLTRRTATRLRRRGTRNATPSNGRSTRCKPTLPSQHATTSAVASISTP
ncbi:transposase [Streptomyces sp. NPDC048650]|uniref:transposase n=1 Tax=Streptomyces sp. NPDC048650 TaxID=3365583 RepID=UPI00371F5AAD